MLSRKHLLLRLLLMMIVAETGLFLTIIIVPFLSPVVSIFWYAAALFSLTAAASWIGLDVVEIRLKGTNEKWYKTKEARSSIVMLFMVLFCLYNGSGLASSNLTPLSSSSHSSTLVTIVGPLLLAIVFFFFAMVSVIHLYRKLHTVL